MIECFGQPNLLGFGLALMGLSVLLFGFVKQMEGKATVIILSLLLRFIQGIASAILNTAAYSFASLIYPDPKKMESAISMLEATSGIGLIIGPIIGSSIYTAVGFKWTFVLLGAILLPLAFLINCCLHSKLYHY